MTNVTIRHTATEISSAGKIPATLQPFIMARFGAFISSLQDFDLEMALNKIILVSYAEMGLKTEAGDKTVTFLIETMVKDLRGRKYERITVEEIQLFIKNGIRGEYGTFKSQLSTINIQNIFFWIKSGMESQERDMAFKEWQKAVAAAEYTPKAPDMLWSKKKCVEVFTEYVSTGTLPQIAFAYYGILCDHIGVEYTGINGEKIKTLVTDAEARKKLIQEAKKEYDAILQKAKTAAEFSGNFRRAKDITALLASGGTDTATFENLIKKMFLKYFFDQLIKDRKELEI